MTTSTNGRGRRGSNGHAPAPVAVDTSRWADLHAGRLEFAGPGGGRRSRVLQDAYASLLDGLNVATLLQPFQDATDWRTLNLDSQTLSRIDETRLIEILVRFSPELNRAWWDFQRMFNPGWEVHVFRPGTETEDKRGQAAVDVIFDQIKARYGSVDVLHGRLSTSAFMRGALLTELVLARDGRTFADFYVADPKVVRFRRANDPVRGTVWEMGQYDPKAPGQFRVLDAPTVMYIPVDPYPDSPLGVPMVSAALNPATVKVARTNDWGRVLAMVGYPRIDATIDLEVIKALPQVQADPTQFEPSYVKRRDDFRSAYRTLEPDDAPVHGSDITLKPLSVAGGTNLAGAEGLLALLDRSLIRALKTQPLMMGINEATTETHANRQWELQVAGIKAIQHLGESMWERQLTLALNLQGIQADVQFRYAELRAAEEMRDEQVRQLRNQNAAFEYWMGWDSQQETAEEITEHDPDQPEPRAIPAGWMQVGPLTPVAAGGGAGGGSGGAGGSQPAQDATGNDGEQADDANLANADAGANR